MGIFSKVGEALLGSTVKSVENVALEFIQTDMEKAKAEALMVKTLDPNGMMRRDTMRFICRCYGFYLFFSVPMILASFFGWTDAATTKLALDAITDTFTPITGLFGLLASASFGVNATNNWKDVRLEAK